jgi:predicted DsbA family dithiol-disulfide isomerase
VSPKVIPNSRRALEASEYARERGAHELFHSAVFHKLFAQDQDIGCWSVLRAVAEDSGLDADEMQTMTISSQYRAAVNAQIAEARALGITGVPAFIFADRLMIIGAQPYRVFQEAMERLNAEPSSA